MTDERELLKKRFLELYFSREKGIGYNFGRAHINSCDFSLDVYTSVEEGAKKTTHWVYFVSNAPEDQQSIKLPDASKYAFEVSRVADGYVVVYHRS